MGVRLRRTMAQAVINALDAAWHRSRMARVTPRDLHGAGAARLDRVGFAAAGAALGEDKGRRADR